MVMRGAPCHANQGLQGRRGTILLSKKESELLAAARPCTRRTRMLPCGPLIGGIAPGGHGFAVPLRQGGRRSGWHRNRGVRRRQPANSDLM
jgi:hypothetical protein